MTGGQGKDYLRMKIGRAYKHLLEFDSLVVAHCTQTAPYIVTEHDDVENDRYTLRCRFAPIDGDVVLSLADAVYALRSGLDQLAWQLALLNNPAPSKDTMFPIHADDSLKSEKLFRRRVSDMTEAAAHVIRQLQPYQRGSEYARDPLWQLNELSNIDKHRLPAGSSTDGSFTLYPGGWTRRDFRDGVEFSWPRSAKKQVMFEARTPELRFGDPVDAALAPGRTRVELTRSEIAEIYRYIREEVQPRFEPFFE